MHPADTAPRMKYPRREIRHTPLGRSAYYSPEDTARFGSTPAFASFQDAPPSVTPVRFDGEAERLAVESWTVDIGPAIPARIGPGERI